MNEFNVFLEDFNEIINKECPNTTLLIYSGGDYIKDFIYELRQDDKNLRFSPYNLYCKSSKHKDAVVNFINKWQQLYEESLD